LLGENMPYKDKEREKEYQKKYRSEHKKEHNENNRKWKKKNPEKVKEIEKKCREKRREKIKEYAHNNKERLQQYKKRWRLENKEKTKEYNKMYWQENKDILRKYQGIYYQKNKERFNAWTRKRRKGLEYKLNYRISGQIYKALKNNKAGRKWETLVGYTLNDLYKRLEKTMPEGYTWNDYLEGRLHIDHIIPVSAFNFDSPEHVDFNRCWALENLRLLPAKDNLVKNAKLSKPFQPALKIQEKKKGGN
jgi:hypothetical protein